MALDQGRVAEIWVPASHKQGSGYLLCDGCVITAYHVIKDHSSQGIELRFLRDYKNHPERWLSVEEIIWRSDENRLDLALLKIKDLSNANPTDVLPRVKKLNLSCEIGFQMCGFPAFRKRKDGKTTILDPYAPQGTIQALQQSKKSGELLLQVPDAGPKQMEDWQGISGSVVFTDDGYLAGVVLQGPKQLEGRLLEAIAIDYLINAEPSFNQCLEAHFHQELVCRDVEHETIEQIYDLELELRALERRKNLIAIESAQNQKETVQLDWEIKECQRKLQSFRQNKRYQAELINLPKQRLLGLLKAIEASHSDVLWLAWQSVGLYQNWRQALTIQDIHTLLLGCKGPDQLGAFLTEIYTQLSRNQSNQYLPELKELAQVICNVDLAQAASVQQRSLQQKASIPKSSRSGEGVLLIKINSNTPPGQFPAFYGVYIWMVSDRQAYEKRFQKLQEDVSQPISAVDKANPIVEGYSIEVKTAKTQAEDIKHALSQIITSIWKNQRLGKLQPQIIFYVPVELIEIDFHNIKWGKRDDVLGWEAPVFVSCINRYEDAELQEYSVDWLECWQVFKVHSDEPLRFHVPIYELQEDEPIDVTNSRKLRKWLLKRKHLQHNRPVTGLGFHSPCPNLIKIFENFLLNGLPIVFWPNRPMEQPELSALQVYMDESSSQLLPAIKKYRINGTTDDAGAMSMLLDNPYLPPPDCEFDYLSD